MRPLQAAMGEMGWTEDKNLRLSILYGGGDRTKIDAAADQLVSLAPELIYVTGLPPALALRKRTLAISRSYSLSSPIQLDLVWSKASAVPEATSPDSSSGIFQSVANGCSCCEKSRRTSIMLGSCTTQIQDLMRRQ